MKAEENTRCKAKIEAVPIEASLISALKGEYQLTLVILIKK